MIRLVAMMTVRSGSAEGGRWDYSIWVCRSANSESELSGEHDKSLGFRLVRSND